jgi:glycosyltransferase involved in cell wall biosynthesis
LRPNRYVIDLQSLQSESRFRGIGRYSSALAEAIARGAGDHEVWLVLCGLVPETVEFVRTRFAGLVPQERIRIFDVPGPLKEIETENEVRARTAEALRDHFLASLAADVVHISSLFEGFIDDVVTSIPAAYATSTVAVTLYDLIPLLRPEQYLGEPRVRRWYFRKAQSLKRAELLLAISESSRREAIDYLDIPEHRVVNISCGVDPCFTPAALTPEQVAKLLRRLGIRRPFILYSGAAEVRKNLDGLVHAFGLLPGTLRERYQLVLAGRHDPGVVRQLHQQAARAGILQDIVFAGYVPDEDLVALYGLCVVFVMPSFHEGFGLPILEAMACGAAAIGSNATSIPEVVERADALFDPTSPSDMAAKLQHVLNDEHFRQQLREHGIRQAKKFTWDSCASKVLEAFEQVTAEKENESTVVCHPYRPRPSLAYVSPLPPQNSGIATYSSVLLPALACHYDIEVITNATEVSDPWIRANFPIRSTEYLEAHGSSYDRILYQLGNSSFHSYMFSLLRQHAGTVTLHDFYLSDLLDWMEWSDTSSKTFLRELYNSHGYPALLQEMEAGREQAVARFPCNRSVLEESIGVIVHSEYSKWLGEKWYGPGTSRDWWVVPLPRLVRPQDGKSARIQLGLGDEDFLLCSFGLLTPSKLNQRVLSAWLHSAVSQESRCRLVFVGEVAGDGYRTTLVRQISEAGMAGRVSITGFASSSEYKLYLQAADAAVQLRSRSRGETSAAILDCLSNGLPTVVNAHGSVAELPEDVVIKLPDEFEDCQLVSIFERLYRDADYRRRYSQNARNYIRINHNVESVAGKYGKAIEHFWQTHTQAREVRTISRLAAIASNMSTTQDDLVAAARAVAQIRPHIGPRRLLLDISGTARVDLKTGIQRVARQMVKSLIEEPPDGFVPIPVNDIQGTYTYGHRFTLPMLHREPFLTDDQFESQPGDIWLGLDISPDGVPLQTKFLERLRANDTRIYYVIYDLLPISRPNQFPANSIAPFRNWLETICKYSDGLICISRSVADELLAWLDVNPPTRLRPLKLGYFHLGAEIQHPLSQRAASTNDVPPEAAAVLNALKARHSLLMVGTLEPRKGHTQALDAFNMLWAEGIKANLIIVGHEGWHVETLVNRLTHHQQAGTQLFWLPAADDEVLAKVYSGASGLLAASEAEGFGLPLIEAARYNLPIVARDIPVFREVAGQHAYYFQGDRPEPLRDAVRTWLKLRECGEAPSSNELPWLTWKQSAEQLMQCVIGQRFYREWHPGA